MSRAKLALNSEKLETACIRTAYARVQAGFFVLLDFLVQIPE